MGRFSFALAGILAGLFLCPKTGARLKSHFKAALSDFGPRLCKHTTPMFKTP